jgi:hypothetical protein
MSAFHGGFALNMTDVQRRREQGICPIFCLYHLEIYQYETQASGLTGDPWRLSPSLATITLSFFRHPGPARSHRASRDPRVRDWAREKSRCSLILEGLHAIQRAGAGSIGKKKNVVDLVTEYDVVLSCTLARRRSGNACRRPRPHRWRAHHRRMGLRFLVRSTNWYFKVSGLIQIIYREGVELRGVDSCHEVPPKYPQSPRWRGDANMSCRHRWQTCASLTHFHVHVNSS